MRIDKVILKAVLSTLLSILVLCGIAGAVLTAFFPSTMMELAYDFGCDGGSARFANRAYKQFGNVYYIAYATEVSIGTGDSAKIEKYGKKFISDDNFADYCANMDEKDGVDGSYAQYIYGQVYSAAYRLGKRSEAIESAFAVNGNAFPRNNAVAAVLFTAARESGTEAVEAVNSVLERLRNLKTQSDFSEADSEYLDRLISLAEEWMATNS